MASLDALIASYKPKADQIYSSQYDATNQNYDTQKQNTINEMNALIAQKQQALGAIPLQYQPQRESNYLANQKALQAAPAITANNGYASGSGLDYNYRQGVNTTWQKANDTVMNNENAAKQTATNDITNTQNTYNANLSNLDAQRAKDLAAIDQAKQEWAISQGQTDYNNQIAAEQAAADKEYQQQQATAKAQADATAAAQSAAQKMISSYYKADANGNVKLNTNDPKSFIQIAQSNGADLSIMPYEHILINPSTGDVTYTNSLADYAEAYNAGYTSNLMYSPNGYGHAVNSLADYQSAQKQGFLAINPRG